MLQYVDVKRIRHHYDGHIHFYIRLMSFSLGCNCFKCTKNGGTVKELFRIIRIGARSEKKPCLAGMAKSSQECYLKMILRYLPI